MPTWTQSCPRSSSHKDPLSTQTLTKCMGLHTYFQKGFVLPMWSDVSITIGPRGTSEYTYQYADQKSCIHAHSPDQMNNYYPADEYQLLKFISPWCIVPSESVDCLYSQPQWNSKEYEDLHVLGGVVDPFYMPEINVNAVIKRGDDEKNLLLKFGASLMHIMPITERKVILRNHLVSSEDYYNLKHTMYGQTFYSLYSRVVKRRGKNKFIFKPDTK